MMTVSLGSYIKISLRFWYYASYCLLSKSLKIFGLTGRIWDKVEVKVSRDLTKKRVNFSALATSNIKLSLFFL